MFVKQQLIIAALALFASADTSSPAPSTATTTASGTSQTAITAPLPSGLSASVVDANGYATTLAVNCNSVKGDACDQAAKYGVTDLTVTVRPTSLKYTLTGTSAGAQASAGFDCLFEGRNDTVFSAEVCFVTLAVTKDGSVSSTSSGTNYQPSQPITANAVVITAGASKLPAPSAASTTGASSSSTSSGAGVAAVAVPTVVAAVYKVLVPVGAALAAGAAFA